MKNFLKYFFILIGILVGAHALYSVYNFIDYQIKNEEVLYCGNIKSMSTYAEYSNKHDSYQGVNNIIVADFGVNGVQSITVSDNTYYTSKVGELICFSWPKDKFKERSGWDEAFLFEGGFVSFILCVFVVIGIVHLIIYAFK